MTFDQDIQEMGRMILGLIALPGWDGQERWIFRMDNFFR
jgi:hypothetical protein